MREVDHQLIRSMAERFHGQDHVVDQEVGVSLESLVPTSDVVEHWMTIAWLARLVENVQTLNGFELFLFLRWKEKKCKFSKIFYAYYEKNRMIRYLLWHFKGAWRKKENTFENDIIM